MKRLQAADFATALRRLTWPLRARLGTAGLAGLLLAVAAAALAAWQLAHRSELNDRVAALQRRAQGLAARVAASPSTSQSGAERTLTTLPTLREHAADLQVLFDAAGRHRLVMERSDYQVVSGTDAALVVVVATLPMRGSYAELKQFANDVLQALPHMALQDLRLERPDIGTTELRARVRVSLYYRRAEP